MWVSGISKLDNPTRLIASGQIYSIELMSERTGRWDRYCLPSSSQSNPEKKKINFLENLMPQNTSMQSV